MLNFENIEDLVSYMFNNLDNDDNLISVISNRELTIAIVHELLNYENVILDNCEIVSDDEYDREYIVSLVDDVDSDKWYINVEKSYLIDKNTYVTTAGNVLFHEYVNSKAITDMQNNEFMPLDDYDYFVIGECDDDEELEALSDNTDESNNKPVITSNAVYHVNGKDASKDEYEVAIKRIKTMYPEHMEKILLEYCGIMDEINEWLKLFRWLDK